MCPGPGTPGPCHVFTYVRVSGSRDPIVRGIPSRKGNTAGVKRTKNLLSVYCITVVCYYSYNCKRHLGSNRVMLLQSFNLCK